jgi:hypothetical protein
MTRPRFKVGQLMAAVAVVAVVLSFVEGERVRLRRWRYEMRAVAYRARELGARDQERLNRDRAKALGDSGGHYLVRAKSMAGKAAYYAAMREKYRAAIERPWQVVGPDPPPP